MSLSTDSSTPLDNRRVDGVAVLLRGDAEMRAEIRRLRKRVRELEASRDRWRSEARAWKWGALR